MSKAYDAVVDEYESADLLTTGDVAKLLGVSLQHVIDLCTRGDLPYTMRGSHRRIRRTDVERYRAGRTRLTRDQRRSIWLAHAVAGTIVERPREVIARARIDLDHLESTQRPNKWTREWRRLLDGPTDDVLHALTSPSQRSRELRQNSPFLHALEPETRQQILIAFSHDDVDHETTRP
ncbi:MAG: helix-turn-helix domain-containing protein [Microbacteriaceae bacterium]